MKRKKIIVGNWKMNKNLIEVKDFFEEFKNANFNLKDNLIIGIAVPFVNIFIANELKSHNLQICSQDISIHNEGAYTGDISPKMLLSFNVTYSIIGHSERRKYQFENDEIVNEKAKNALNNGITPIICVGETLSEYESGKSENVVKHQVLNAIKDLDVSKIVIAYEPIWAIGTGRTATIEYAQKMCNFIRTLTSESTLIQYGGSVNSKNINDLLNQKDIDGALVGGASLDVNSFIDLIKK